MDQRLRDVLQNRFPTYQHPFFHVSSDETEEALHRRITQLKDHGLRSMVLEYQQANGSFGLAKFDEIWWDKLRIISKICNDLGMTYWIQDAAPFPTGAANGFFETKEYKSKAKRFIVEKHMDLCGPVSDALISVNRLMRIFQNDVSAILKPRSDLPDKLLAVVALQRSPDGKAFMPETTLDLTDLVKDGVLRCNLPSGHWRIFTFVETYNGGRRHYMNLLDSESVRVLIDAVYEPHYQNLVQELGRTWRGFFYDEPEIGNLEGYVFDSLPGKKHRGISIPLPWCEAMPDMIKFLTGSDYIQFLPALWYDCGERTAHIRFTFMDAVTRLIAQGYNRQVGAWCAERGIGYMGHVLEDENSHTRLGCGDGHFFRVQEGQHIAGVDLISVQVLPGLDSQGVSWYGASDGDGEFYHYGLAKLASSAAHIDPQKRGRSVCECLALIGPAAGTRLRKFIIDHLLVNGINSLVPADSGIDLQPVFSRQLNTYVDKMCHLLNDGIHMASVAVLYHAEAEWCGEFQPFHKVGKVLIQNTLDYDVIPADVFSKQETHGTHLSDGRLVINGECYQALVVPSSQFIAKSAADFIVEAVNHKFPVVFIDRHPDGICENNEEIPRQVSDCIVVSLADLPGYLKDISVGDISISDHQPYLRHFHYRRGELDLFMFHNEEPHKSVSTTVSLPTTKPVAAFDAMTGCITSVNRRTAGNRTEVNLNLQKYESILILTGDLEEFLADGPDWDLGQTLTSDWRISFESMDGNSAPQPLVVPDLFDIGASDHFPEFYGQVIYETVFDCDVDSPKYLSLGYVSECAQVFLNGQETGVSVAEPYRLNISGKVNPGKNNLKVLVFNSIARSTDEKMNPGNSLLSTLGAAPFISLEPCGMLGPVRIYP